MRRWVLCLAFLLAVGCSGSQLSEEAAADLQQHTAAVRAAAEAGDVAAARESLDLLRVALDAHADAGRVGPRRAREILAAAELVATRLPALPPDAPAEPPATEDTPAPTDTSPPPTGPQSPDDDEDEDRDKDKEKEKEEQERQKEEQERQKEEQERQQREDEEKQEDEEGPDS